jgi:hypothetical protein
MRTLLSLLALAVLVRAESPLPEPPRPPDPKQPEVPAVWAEHPKGDEVTVPCAHLVKKHPGGCLAPCTCPKTVQHADGDDGTVPCVHRHLEHPGGDDSGKRVPCVHLKNGTPEHKGGDPVMVPCTHEVADHPDGDKVKVPCKHVILKHPDGEPGTNVPCMHLVPEHSGGDRKTAPCVHRIPCARRLESPKVEFYWEAGFVEGFWVQALEDQAKKVLEHFAKEGIQVGSGGPLRVLVRDVPGGDPWGKDETFRSSWRRPDNLVVVALPLSGWKRMAGGREDRAKAAEALRELRFLSGYAIAWVAAAGTCAVVAAVDSADAPAPFTGPLANFCAAISLVAALTDVFGTAAALVEMPIWDVDLEKAVEVTRASFNGGKEQDVPFTADNPFRVAAVLWDLVDTHDEGSETAAIPLGDVWRAIFPDGGRKGGEAKSLDEILGRLKERGKGAWDEAIEKARSLNLPKK